MSGALAPPGEFCWLDLAASDLAAAKRFYANAFGWSFHERSVNGGRFTLCQVGRHAIASLYPLRRVQLAQGVPSHWTPYVRVDSVDESARRAVAHSGRVLVAPFDVQGMARIALIEDAVGALVGLWQALPGGA